ncbi:MAG: hypothetical protein Q605_AUC01073G0001 [Actinomyces urogenitalis DORA_12]|uniref:Uncharacterized protein n=1 Tax=Actinomyces urogenitalis DORA_12 TaxID=1403939 RepID=W1V6F3_9ACTO|nr:MAG: hypothetical protein Q605_AUC01073G0001 [Actinomyces urogenitalis DORA_12]
MLGVRAVQQEVAEADLLHATLLEVLDPGAQGRLETSQVPLRHRTAVAQPHGGVLHRVLGLALDDPRVDVRRQPGLHALAPVLEAVVLPVAEHDHRAPDLQVIAQRGHELGQHRAPGVAVLHEWQPRFAHGRRGQHERRVGGDEIEAASGHRLQEGALNQLQALRVRPGQGGVESGEGQRPGGDVRGHHVLGVLEEVEGLDAAAAPQVQGGAHRLTRGQAGQRQPGASDPQHVVRFQGAPGLQLSQVRGNPPAQVGTVLAQTTHLVRAQVHAGPD